MPQFTVLLTGFGGFSGATYNPSAIAARELDGTTISSSQGKSVQTGKVVGRVLDVAWDDGVDAGGAAVAGAAKALAKLVNEVKPDLLLSLGIQKVADSFDVEPQAADANDLLKKDVRGAAPGRVREHDSADAVLPLTFPAQAIVRALDRAGLTAVSNPGLGNYLCERIAYEGAWHAKYGSTTKLRMTGFMHVPNPMVLTTGNHTIAIGDLKPIERKHLDGEYGNVLEGVKIALDVCLAQMAAAPRRATTKLAQMSQLRPIR